MVTLNPVILRLWTRTVFKIVDRKKDMLILVSGFNVYPNEIEEVLAASKSPEAGVIGIPDDRSGEVPKAYVVRKDSTLSEKRATGLCVRKELTGYKRPRHIKFVEELPKSNVGKILRKEIRKLEEKEQVSN